MRHSFSIAGAAVLRLAGLTFAGSAQAVPVVSLHQAAPLTIKVADEGTYIKEEERPNQVTPGSQAEGGAGAEPRYVAPDGGGNSSAGEVPELQRAFPSTEWPPSMRHD
jgi:hypothetical protein